MDRASAVQAGLLEGFRTRNVLASDGTTLLHFRNHERKDGSTDASTSIDDPRKGSSSYLFDPDVSDFPASVPRHRPCNLPSLTGMRRTSAWKDAKRLMADRPGTCRSGRNTALDFWMDAEHGTSARHASGTSTVVSGYSAPDSLPTEVEVLDVRGDALYKTVFVRTRLEILESVDPTRFTPGWPGHADRHLGVRRPQPASNRLLDREWTFKDLPEPKSTNAPPLHQLPELMALLETVPAAPEALEAAQWILGNTPDGMETEAAADVLIREHLGLRVSPLVPGSGAYAPRSARRLLEGILNDNPDRDTRGLACLILATFSKEESKFGSSPNPPPRPCGFTSG